MLGNNHARLNIVLSMENPYDYRDFSERCAAIGVEAMPFGTYAQKVEALMTAREKYPDRHPADAYLKHIEENNGFLQPPSLEGSATATSSGCSGCGGGKVR